MTHLSISHITYYLSLLRIQPADITTPEGRARERVRRVALTSFVAAAGKGVTLLISLISIPLTLNYLGAERYGMWMVAASAIALLEFADLGIGNGLLTLISESDGRDDRAGARVFVSSAFFVLSVIAMGLLLIFVLVYSVIPWHRVLNVASDAAVRESAPTIALLAIFAAFNFPIGIAQRIQLGYQEGYTADLWSTAGNVFGLIGVLTAIYLHAGLPWLVFAMCGAPTFAKLLNWFFLFMRSRPWLFPTLRFFDYAIARKIITTGFYFLVLQAMILIGNASDSLIIAHYLGASAVSAYVVVQRIFMVTMFSQFFVIPLWPAFGEAISRNDYPWARKTMKNAIRICLLLSAATALPLLLFGKKIINVWIGPGFAPSYFLLTGFALFVFLSSQGGVVSSFLKNGNLIKKQVAYYAIATFVSLLLKFPLVQLWGTAGAIWATVVGYGLFFVIPATRFALRRISQA